MRGPDVWGVAALLLTLVASATAYAEPPVPPPPPVAPVTANAPEAESPMSAADEAIVRHGVQQTYDAYHDIRTRNGWGNIAGGVVLGGLGAWFVADPQFRGSIFQLLGVAVIGSGVASLTEGIWNVASTTPEEDIAAKVLNDRMLLTHGGGMLFLEQEARQARRARLLGGTVSIVNAATYGISLLPLLEFVSPQDRTVLLVFVGVMAGLQVVNGVVTLIGETQPERIYRETLDALNGGALPAKSGKTISTHFSPTLLRTPEGKTVFGGAFGARF